MESNAFDLDVAQQPICLELGRHSYFRRPPLPGLPGLTRASAQRGPRDLVGAISMTYVDSPERLTGSVVTYGTNPAGREYVQVVMDKPDSQQQYRLHEDDPVEHPELPLRDLLGGDRS